MATLGYMQAVGQHLGSICRQLLIVVFWLMDAGYGGELHSIGRAAEGHQRAGKALSRYSWAIACKSFESPCPSTHAYLLFQLFSTCLPRRLLLRLWQVASFRADGPERAFAQEEFGLKSFPTIVLFPRRAQGSRSRAFVTYPSERRDPASLLAFVSAIAGPVGETWSGP